MAGWALVPSQPGPVFAVDFAALCSLTRLSVLIKSKNYPNAGDLSFSHLWLLQYISTALPKCKSANRQGLAKSQPSGVYAATCLAIRVKI